MLYDALKLLGERPFVPFVVVTSAGKEYRVESPDHAHLTPKHTRLTIYFDDESLVSIPALHIASIETPSD